MADNLIFRIGFDLETAVKEAEREGASAIKRLETIFSRQPLVLKTDASGFDELGKSAEVLKSRLKEIKDQWDKMPTSVKFDLDSGGKVKQLTSEGKALWEELLRINTALQGTSMGIQQMARESQRQLEAENKAEQKRQQAIAASLRAEYQRIEAKKQAEAASRRELQMLNQRYAAEERRQRLAASQASIAKRQQVIKTLRAEENTIVNITAKLQHWQRVMNSSAMDGRQFRRATEEVQRLSQKLSEAKARISQLTSMTSNASARQASAVRQVSQEFKNQDGYVSRLLKRLAVYASFSYASQFLTSIREVTAQFELQRISLGAIIQDQQKANQIFAEIKSFALTSPLKILDLTKYAKQVAAYGFAADRVFDVTKRLADISVGLGVDMGRLTLAVSQIKAATVLKASELRQLTETGLPMLDLLSKKLTETQGKLVSAADVMDLISKRAISYEMVEEILYDLTDAGGMFYNMQVKQSQTLFGMWSKLGDAAAIMYNQIGNTGTVNGAMKLSISILESMMRNWKTTARVLDSFAVALTVYVVGLKNAAIASKALTSAVALENLAHQQQIIRTPKVVAGIIGINNAKKISTLLTNLHTKAVLSEAAATNVLTKVFWKLTAAMLANPWVATASAIALVGVALFHFIGNTETAAERAEKLNESVSALNNTESTTKPLVEAYTELSNKTERTVEEQKKLRDITQELAKRFPDAVIGIDKFNNSITISIDKVSKLSGLMKTVTEQNVRNNLEKSEADLTMLQNLLVKYEKFLKRGGGSFYDADKGATVFGFWLSESDKKKIRERQAELVKQIEALEGEIVKAKRELGDLPPEEVEAIEGFGAWKKKLTEFSKDVGGIKVKLFDDSTINQFGTLEEALDAAAKKYKEAAESVETYNKILESKLLTKDQIDKITAERDEAQAMKELSEEALNYYNAMALLLKVMGGGRSGQSDPRLNILQEMANTLKQVNKEYDELAKKEGITKALADTQDKYANTFKYLQSLATKYKFELPDFGVPTDASSLTKYLDAVKEAMKKLPKSEKAVLSLETDIADINMADAQKKIESELKRLSDRISRTKTAKEFYEKILGMTGDYDLAAKVSLSIYGDTGYDLQKQLAEQVRQYFQNDQVSIEIPVDVITADNQINYKRLGEFAEQMKEKLGEEPYKAIKKIAEEGQKDLAKTYEGYLKDLEKAKTYADKRVELARTTAAKIREIESNPQYTKEQKAELKRGYQEREDREAAKLEYEAFKDTPLYVQMFEDLEHASTSTLEMMKSRLEGLSGVWGTALDPTQLKEIQSRMNEIDEQLRKRNPFKTLKESYQQYRDAVKSMSLQGAVENAGAAAKELYDRTVDYGADSAQARAAEKELKARERIVEIARRITAENKKGAKALDEAARIANDNLRTKQAELDTALAQEEIARDKSTYEDPNKDPKVIAAHEAVEAAKEEVNLAERVAEITTNNAKTAKTLKENFASAANQVTQYMGMAGDLAHAVADTMEALGGDEDDIQFWNDIGDAIGDLTAGFQGIIDSILSLNVAGIISNAIGVIPNMVKGFVGLFSAGKVRKANKEIKRQQKLLDQLEYTYGRLQYAADKLFGRDYVNNYNQQLKNLQAQQQAYLKQAQAERSKGKKEDKEKTKQFEEQARETADKIKELQDDLVAHFTGQSRTDVARQMAKSWIDARASMSDTFAAIKGDYQDLIKNMIVEGAAARVIESALMPVWDSMQKMLEKNDVEGAIDSLINGMDAALTQANNGMEVLWQALEAKGYNMKKLIGDTDSEYTGIAKSVAGATSEEINNVAAIGNTLMYYVSPIPRIDENLARVVAIMEGRGASAIPQTTSAGWTDWQQQAMDNYNAIARNTADTVVECRRAAEACERIASTFKVKGSTKGLNVFLNS